MTLSSTLLRLEFGDWRGEINRREKRERFSGVLQLPCCTAAKIAQQRPANQQQVVLRNIRQQLKHPWMTHGAVARGIRKEKETQEMEKTKTKNKIKNQS